MKITYDPYADAVYIYLATGKHELTTHVTDDESIMVDVSEDRAVFGIEILDASSRLNLEELKTLEYVEHGPPVPASEPREELAAEIRDQQTEYQTQ